MKHTACSLLLAALCGAALAQTEPRWQATWSHVVGERNPASDTSREPRSNALALERITSGAFTIGARHRYDIVDLPAVAGIPAATNGHLHRLSAGAQWNGERTRMRMEPTLAVSSNVGRQPKSLTWSDLQPNASWERRIGNGAAQALWLGVQADARLGRWLGYPTLRWHNDEAAATHWQLGFPESRWRRRLAEHWALAVGVAPDGGQWQVRDREFDSRSRVRLRLWRAEASVQWLAGEHVALALVAGRAFAGESRYSLLDGSAIRADVPDANFFGARATARW